MYDTNTDKGRLVVELKHLYEVLRRKQGSYELYNLLEKCIIGISLTPNEEKDFAELNLE
jgi:hypothetical protein